jgi:glutaredoxin
MKTTTVMLLISALLMTSAVPVDLSASMAESTLQPTAFTHTLFAELGTFLSCPHCHTAREQLHKIYTSNDYPFYYVSLVDFENDATAERIDEYNIAGYPTVWFDGGYRVEVGGGPQGEQDYRQHLTICGDRIVPDIAVNLTATWLGNAQIDIDVTVLNHESSSYNGHIRVYVTEVESTMGWNDTTGHPYTFPLLDYAFNQDISIAASGTWLGSMIWDGYEYDDGHGHDFSTIQFGNLQVIAVVFNSESHQGFSDPPSGYPFNAYYVDDAAGVWLGTPHPPAPPTNPKPADGAINVDISKDLWWTTSDPDIGDQVYSDLYFGTTNPPPLLQANIFETTYDVGIMQFHTMYYWQIIAHDSHGLVTEGPLWSFTTGSVPDSTPPTVTIEKPKSGYVYLQDNDGMQRLLFKNALIIGKITIEVNAIDTESGIDRVLFFIDGVEQAEITTAPYLFLWTRFSLPFISHTISIVAYDEMGNTARQDVKALKFL